MRCAEKKRSRKNGIPDEIEFQIKPQIALDLIDRAKTNGIRVMAWTADELGAVNHSSVRVVRELCTLRNISVA